MTRSAWRPLLAQRLQDIRRNLRAFFHCFARQSIAPASGQTHTLILQHRRDQCLDPPEKHCAAGHGLRDPAEGFGTTCLLVLVICYLFLVGRDD